MKNIKLYNTPYEVGIRILILLNECKDILDLQRIIIYDYLILHYGDVDKNYESLHPSNPFHATELIIKRQLVKEGLDLICKKGLIDIDYSDKGFYYQINKIGENFLQYIESKYSDQIRYYSNLVNKRFGKMTEEELNGYINYNIGKWKGEFERETLFRGDRVE